MARGGVAQLLAVNLRGPTQDLRPLRGIRSARRPRVRAGPPCGPSSCVLSSSRRCASRGAAVGRAPAPRHAARPPGRARCRRAASRRRRDLLEPGQQLLGADAGQPGALERELQQIGQRRPVALVAEVVGVGAQGDLVFGLELQDRVQVDGRLVAIAQPIAVERRQLQHVRTRCCGSAIAPSCRSRSSASFA